MATSIPLWFDCRRSYFCLAVKAIDALERNLDVTIEPRPYALGIDRIGRARCRACAP